MPNPTLNSARPTAALLGSLRRPVRIKGTGVVFFLITIRLRYLWFKTL